MAMDIVEAMVQAEDIANKAIVGHCKTKSMRLMMYTETVNAQWAADWYIKSLAYPLASLTFTANRNAFRLQVGDNFKWSSARLNITDMVFMVNKIVEENLMSETIRVDAIEDIEYSVGAATFNNIPIGNSPRILRNELYKVENVIFLESPYLESGSVIQIIPIVAKRSESETGFTVWMSTDGGTSYTRILEECCWWSIRATLVNEYPAGDEDLDDAVGFRISISDFADNLSTITRAELFGSTNLSLLGDDTEAEFITWQTITPVSTGIYDIIGVYRGRLGTERKTHAAGTSFYFVGNFFDSTDFIIDDTINFTYNNNVHFKAISYNEVASSLLSEADAYDTTFLGICRRPYPPTNFECNGLGEGESPVYTTNCDLSWDPRLRTSGLDFTDPDYAAGGTWEGYFKVKVYVNNILVRTTSTINDNEWIYNSSMNGEDNGELADTIVFKLYNYTTYSEVIYTSVPVTLTVTNTASSSSSSSSSLSSSSSSSSST